MEGVRLPLPHTSLFYGVFFLRKREKNRAHPEFDLDRQLPFPLHWQEQHHHHHHTKRSQISYIRPTSSRTLVATNCRFPLSELASRFATQDGGSSLNNCAVAPPFPASPALARERCNGKKKLLEEIGDARNPGRLQPTSRWFKWSPLLGNVK